MAETSTFVKIDRNIIRWRWFKSAKTLQLFLYLILNANIKEADFETITVQRGQLVTSYPALATVTSMSVQSVRTAIQHLKSTGEITVKSYPRFSVITIVNYDRYQTCQQGEQQSNNRLSTGNQQAINSQVTTIKEYKELKNGKKERNIRDAFVEFADGDEVLLQALRDFEQMRKTIKAPLTERAKTILLSKLQTFPRNQWAEILNQSVLNGWKSIYPLDRNKKQDSFTLSNGMKTTNPFLEIYDEEFNHDKRRDDQDIVIVESGVS